MTKALFGIILILPFIVLGQNDQPADPWEQLRFLEGTWKGSGEGLSGTSTVTHTYEFVLGGNFLRMKTRSIFEPQEKNPQGEIHEDIGFFSYDKSRKTFILRAFYIEGFVNTYVLDSVSEDGNTMMFATEGVENGPPGTRARLEFERASDTELEERFFVSFPGKEFSCFSTNRVTRE